MTAMQELVVPKSMPITLDIKIKLSILISTPGATPYNKALVVYDKEFKLS
jgi:hypothetical protein